MSRVAGSDLIVNDGDPDLLAALTALRRGESAGLEVIARRYQVTSLRLAFAILGDRESAEDAVADSLVTAFQRIKQFDANRPFAPWFYRIVINTAKKSRRRRRIESRAHRQLSVASSVDAAAEALAADERREVFDAVQALPTDERVAVVLRYYVEASIREMVDLLGWPSGTVKRRLYNARRRLRTRLAGRLGLEIDEKEDAPWFTPVTETPR
jgi:RNA polymerase sigma-70 factor (ECF subfamily)